jgi:ADP-heptose:LPS heptosyltransferase
MSNILIIKHGSLGDIVQISGVIRDIREANNDKKIFILTTFQYAELLGRCPYLDGVLIDKRLPRWNLLYLLKLRKKIRSFNFSYIYDLQNSSRTIFYKKFLFNNIEWSNTETTLNPGEKKSDFDKDPVLDRFKLQLEKSNIKTKYCLKPNFLWAVENVDKIINQFLGKKFVLLFPFSSSKLTHKRWPHYNNLITIIKKQYANLEIVIAPGPGEIEMAKNINATIITNNQMPLSIPELAGLIKKSIFIIGNDTGPAHMAAHLGMKGLVLFGQHTTPKKVSIETDKFKAFVSNNLEQVNANDVFMMVKNEIDKLLID